MSNMSIELRVTVELSRTQGKFVSKQELADQLVEQIESANPDSIDVDDSEYEVTEFAVEQV